MIHGGHLALQKVLKESGAASGNSVTLLWLGFMLAFVAQAEAGWVTNTGSDPRAQRSGRAADSCQCLFALYQRNSAGTCGSPGGRHHLERIRSYERLSEGTVGVFRLLNAQGRLAVNDVGYEPG